MASKILKRCLGEKPRADVAVCVSESAKSIKTDPSSVTREGRERVKCELGFTFFRGWEMGFCALGLGFMKQKQ